MEHVAGQSLADVIAQRKPLSLGARLEIIESLCWGLAYAHRAGIVHRDIKPSNLLIGDDGILKVLDFGIAAVGGLSPADDVVVGTPSYMSPEQIRGEQVDGRSDVFSAGAVLYELLTYTKAFQGSSTAETINRVLSDAPAPLTTLLPGAYAALIPIVERSLEKDRDRRYAKAGDLGDDLRRFRLSLAPSPRTSPLSRASRSPTTGPT